MTFFINEDLITEGLSVGENKSLLCTYYIKTQTLKRKKGSALSLSPEFTVLGERLGHIIISGVSVILV